jgi:hypothetical protein
LRSHFICFVSRLHEAASAVEKEIADMPAGSLAVRGDLMFPIGDIMTRANHYRCVQNHGASVRPT